jgi:glycosyltransferase involved in cell wall biosynthesis
MATAALRRTRLTELGPKVESGVRPTVRAKSIFVGTHKFFIKGVTYGSFSPNEAGIEYHDCRQIQSDFAMMACNGINTVRIQHTVPPVHLLDIAAEHNLRVMVGLGAEQAVGYLLDGKRPSELVSDIRNKVRSCVKHPAVLAYALGNEIPADTARWLGRERIESYLHVLYDAVKDEDPEGLVTYVNYPTTEYLQLPFLDFCCFNVFLENKEQFEAYLARLQNIALDRPLVMSELGLDARRNGTHSQAAVLNWQIRSTFEAGCAGAVVFSWTDEWYSGGGDVTDWEFGLTDRARSSKPALPFVRKAFEECPFPPEHQALSFSVVVCSYNGSRTIRECLEHVMNLKYPNYEVIVVDDGSTDDTAQIAKEFDVRLIQTENRGLSAARNAGRELARGEIVAYLDDDAYPDPDWLSYYNSAFQRSDHVLIGGPNLSPLHDPAVAQCVACSPGGPNHVLLTDTIAEHVPGCNMAFRKSRLVEIGGFDPIFRTAGDDVDVCWRIQEKGWTVGFAPAAVVWHHRRSSISAYWKQQRGYGKAEALLQQKWPGRFNPSNHLPWAGRIYVAGLNMLPGKRAVVHHGVWGQAAFQSLYGGSATLWDHLFEIPELHLLNAALALLSLLGVFWRPMLLFLAMLVLGVGYPILRACLKARQAQFRSAGRFERFRLRALTAFLHVLQPVARLWGRLQHGLTPWKRRGNVRPVFPHTRQLAVWTETWVDPDERRMRLEQKIIDMGFRVWRGNSYERWDFEIIGGLLGSARVLMAVENHGSGRQYVRVASSPRYSRLALSLGFMGVLIAAGAAASGNSVVAFVLAAGAALLWFATILETGRSQAAIISAARQPERHEPRELVVRVFDSDPRSARLKTSLRGARDA